MSFLPSPVTCTSPAASLKPPSESDFQDGLPTLRRSRRTRKRRRLSFSPPYSEDDEVEVKRVKMSFKKKQSFSLKPAFEKGRHYELIREMREYYGTKPDLHAERIKYLEMLEPILASGWHILVLECPFQNSTKTYFELHERAAVFDNIFQALLVVYKTFWETDGVQQEDMDMQAVELPLFRLIEAIAKSKVYYTKPRNPRPDPQQRTEREAEYWDKFGSQLNSTHIGKIWIKESDATGAATILQGLETTVEDDHGNVTANGRVGMFPDFTQGNASSAHASGRQQHTVSHTTYTDNIQHSGARAQARTNPGPCSLNARGEPIYEVEAITDHHLERTQQASGTRFQWWYEVRWVGWEETDWIPFEALIPGAIDLVVAYHDGRPHGEAAPLMVMTGWLGEQPEANSAELVEQLRHNIRKAHNKLVMMPGDSIDAEATRQGIEAAEAQLRDIQAFWTAQSSS